MSERGPGSNTAEPDRVYEASAQLERTALAWSRTLLALAVNGALLIKVGGAVGGWAVVVGAAVMIIGMAGWVATSRTYRRLRGRPAQQLLARPAVALTATITVLVVGLADLLAIAAYGSTTGG